MSGKSVSPRVRHFADMAKRAAVLRDLHARGADLALMDVDQWIVGEEFCPYLFVYRRARVGGPAGSVITLKVLDAVTGKTLLPHPKLGSSIGFLPHQAEVLRTVFKADPKKRKR